MPGNDDRRQTLARDAVYRLGTTTQTLEKVLAPKLAQLDTHYGARPRKRSLVPGERLPLGWRESPAAPVLAVDRYTVLLWPGLQYRYERWTGLVDTLREQLTAATVCDLGGRPPGPLLGKLPREAHALLVRPDGHLDALVPLDDRAPTAAVRAVGQALARHVLPHATAPQLAGQKA
ncbi:hypothetical protein [Streptomyces beihaiensis]|uniref:Uncharacterized protein n=1 Tax=Streptomyces beihaiensis TaxID=2984495 RepID=A0ABT3U010_9ACTN|nr:hypothetical protein [Streptomyces beihaiensis]MCX3061932.1 hypothetical protein [Streptomyces beihaiensis]